MHRYVLLVGAIIVVVIIYQIASHPRYFYALNHIYRTLTRLPKVVIIVASILSLVGLSDLLDFHQLFKTAKQLTGRAVTSTLTHVPALAPMVTQANGTSTNERLVSDTTKKIVAAQQEWKCGLCGRLLDETYEVDHVTPLYKGGSNDIKNLMALDPICHRKKTNADRLEIPVESFIPSSPSQLSSRPPRSQEHMNHGIPQ